MLNLTSAGRLILLCDAVAQTVESWRHSLALATTAVMSTDSESFNSHSAQWRDERDARAQSNVICHDYWVFLSLPCGDIGNYKSLARFFRL